MNLSHRVINAQGSQSVAMAQKIIELREAGENIISFNVGEPDFLADERIINATKSALELGKTRYSLVPGEMNLRELIAKKLNQDYNLNKEAKNIALSNGSKQVLYTLFQMICNPGDEVLIPSPYWVSFPESVKLAGAKPIFVNSSEDNRISIENIKKKINAKTKAIIVNTPSNPTGLIEKDETLKEIVKLAKEHNFYIISDEAYEGLVFDGLKNKSCAHFDKELSHTLVVQTFSKSFCMTGFRLGYVAASTNFIKAFSKLQSHVCGNPPVFTQDGALEALKIEDELVKNMKSIFERRRDLAFNICKEIFPSVQKPEGAFYLFPKIPQEMLDQHGTDIDIAMLILEKAKVAVLPGSYFGTPGFLRICFAAKEEDIIKGMNQIKDVL